MRLSGADSGNYALTLPTTTANITAVPLTVTANLLTRFYGQPNPTLTYTLSGFVGGEDAVGANVSGSPNLATTATVTSAAGSYAITVAAGSLSASNYNFPNLVNGTLTINTANPTVVNGAPVRVLKVSTQAVRLGKSKKTTHVIVLQLSKALTQRTLRRSVILLSRLFPAAKNRKARPLHCRRRLTALPVTR